MSSILAVLRYATKFAGEENCRHSLPWIDVDSRFWLSVRGRSGLKVY
jgi:hypothetical protein